MRRVVNVVLLVWVTFCMLLFHWIGLLGEAFGYLVNDLVYLKLVVLLWMTHGLLSFDAMKTRRLQMGLPMCVVHNSLIAGVLVFDGVLLCTGRPVNLWFIAVPTIHAAGVLGLWQMDHSKV
jgi:hypothetical protein